MQKVETYSHTRTKTFDLIITSLLIALVFVSTVFLNIKLPITANGGLVHLGTGMLFIASILFGPKKGAIAGSFGMALFDIVGGWMIWSPITFIARGLQGYIVGKIAWSGNREGKSVPFNLFAMIVSIPPMIAVYYVGEGILFANWIAPLASIPGDFVQNILGIVICHSCLSHVKKSAIF